uniref:Uncharacterized protein n=1 Tax=Ditylenchus dipsaci TaxID=166011 RepID=A0A915DK91_9BILA
MSPSSSGMLRPTTATHTSLFIHLFLAILITQDLFVGISCKRSINSDAIRVRVRRQAREPESLLTVEWEGIQSGDHPDSSIRGFIVEYRAEKEAQWNVHSGVIPYKGPNHQYRVQVEIQIL